MRRSRFLLPFSLGALSMLALVAAVLWAAPGLPDHLHAALGGGAAPPGRAAGLAAAPSDAAGEAPSAGAAPGERPPADAPSGAAPPDAAPPAADAGSDAGLLIPVQGVGAASLVDTYEQARGQGRRHDAIDIAAPRGTPVLASADGAVLKLFRSERGGITLYQLAAGTTPLDVSSNVTERHSALVKGKWEPLERVCPGLPEGFYAVVRRALQVRPEDRYPDAAAMREDLEAVALAHGVAVGPSSLAGYVQEQSGAFSVIPTGVKRLRPSMTGVPSMPSRTRVPAVLGKRRVRAALGVVTAFALLGGGFVALSLWLESRPSPKEIAGMPPPAAEPPSPAAAPEPSKAQEPAVATAAEPAPPAAEEPGMTAEELVAMNGPSEPKPGRERTRRPARKPAKAGGTAPGSAVEKPAEPEPEEVLTGEGTLRIRTTAPGRVEVKLPGLGRVGLPVLNQRIAAGRHTAEFHLEGGGTARCTLTVRPDRRTIIVFNGKTCATE